MTTKYRYNADKGEPVPVETDEERMEREGKEAKLAADERWQREQEERDKRRVGSYL